MQELFTALQMLQKGATSLATRRAVDAANEQVQQVLQTETDEAKQLASLRQVAGGLTRQLAGMGVDAATIEQAGKSIAPAMPTIQTAEQAVLMGSPEQRKRGQKLIDDDLKLKRDVFGQKLAATDEKDLRKEFDTFRDKVAKADLDSLAGADSLEGLLKDGSPMAYESAKTFLTRSMGDSRPSDKDREALQGNPSAWAHIQRNWNRLAAGKILEEDKEMMGALAKVLKNRAATRIRTKAQAYAKGRKGLVNMDPSELSDRLVQQTLGESLPSAGASETPMPGANGMPSFSGQAPAPQGGGLRSFLRPK